jgi:1,4-alpha-glucan branching enzyme
VNGYVALVLHAHLPYVRHPEHARSIEERWLFEALWESYLPLLGVLDRLAAEGVEAPLTISVSPPLLAMLRDHLLRARFEDHLERLSALASRESQRVDGDGALAPVVAMYQRRLTEVRDAWHHIDRDVIAALVRHADAGRIELTTTAATHAYLPGLLAARGSVRAQIRIGREAMTRAAGRAPLGFWLPECAYHPRLGADLAAAGVRYVVVDAHALELARPRPRRGPYAPVLGPSGIAFFGRDAAASHEVWSRQSGYPGDPVYREFYRDVGFDLPVTALDGEVGPNGTRLMTGLKYHRITGPGPNKEPYHRDQAVARAAEHAEHFVRAREQTLLEVNAVDDGIGAPPVIVAPYDAELFGHWWFEGPEFLEAVLRRLAESAQLGRVAPVTLGAYLARHPTLVVAEPAESTWGEGGFGEVWAGPRVAGLWRHVHHAAQELERALGAARGASGIRGQALDQAVRELLLLEASDWPFMVHGGDMVRYAEARVRTHRGRVARLSAIARGQGQVSTDDASWVREICEQGRFLADLEGPSLRSAFDPWPRGAA